MKLTIYDGSTTSKVAIGSNQVSMVEFAERHRCWHTLRRDRATLRAVDALVRKGMVEVWERESAMPMFRWKVTP